VCLICLIHARADQPPAKPTLKVEFRRAEHRPAEGLTEAAVAGTTEKVYLHKSADATNEDIAEAYAGVDSLRKPTVEITFTKKGAIKIGKVTEEHLDKPLAILIDGKVVSAPIIRSKLSQKALIAGNFTKEEVDKLVKGINGK
jgi:preprotein translocase subunit SecD